MDLVWATDGTPYKYRLTTRYEIPCTVSGTVTVDDTSYRRRLGSRAARPFVGCARLVEHGLDLERAAPGRRHPPARREHPHPRCANIQCRLRPGPRRFDVTELETVSRRGKPSAPTGYR